MATRTSELFNNGAGVRLDPHLTGPSSFITTTQRITGIDASSGLTEILALTGKYAVYYLDINALTSETITVKLTIDGEVIWNDTYTGATTEVLYGSAASNGEQGGVPLIIDSSMSLELQTATDTSVTVDYVARPIK